MAPVDNSSPTVVVWSLVKFVGFHRWPEAPDSRDYLRSRHRHEFNIRASVRVSHSDRDIEFHDLRDMIADWWGPGSKELGRMSCEDIALEVKEHLHLAHDLTVVSVEVSEDGYDGAVLTW